MRLEALFFALVFARVGAFVAVMPLFGGPGTSVSVRAALALSLAVFWFGQYTPPAGPARLDAAGEAPWLLLGLALGREAILGAVVALVFNLFLAPIHIAGELTAQQIGLAQASALGPTNSTPASPLTLILESLAGLVFLDLNLHHLVLATLHASFARYPLGGFLLPLPSGTLLQGVETAQSLGLLLGAPLALALFVVTVSMALMGRAAPQLNLQSVGFSLQALATLLAALFLLPDLVRAMALVLARVGEVVRCLL